MSLFNKLLDFMFEKYPTGQCENCPHKLNCLCYTCENIGCRNGSTCKKEKLITHCSCQDCDRKNCDNCKPEIY